MKVNTKILGFVAIALLVLSIFFNFQQHRKVKELEKFQTNEFEILKAEKDSIIRLNEFKIDSLLLDNSIKEEAIKNVKFSFDSLENIKSKVKIIYKDIVKEVENFDGEKLENYWKNELSK
jgi:hypothetical protein